MAIDISSDYLLLDYLEDFTVRSRTSQATWVAGTAQGIRFDHQRGSDTDQYESDISDELIGFVLWRQSFVGLGGVIKRGDQILPNDGRIWIVLSTEYDPKAQSYRCACTSDKS